MPKEQNAIKLLLTLSFFCFISYAYSQIEIEGRYSSLMPYQEYYNYFDFDKNGTFEYHSGADLGENEFGKGHYRIKNDSLILNYDLTKLKYESYFKAKKYYNSKDSIVINVKINNFKKDPLKNIMVYSFPNYVSAKSNINGITFIKLKKGSREDKIELHIEGEFWAKQILYLNGDSNYNLEVFMNKSTIIGFGHPSAIKNQIVSYKIVEYEDDFIKIDSGKGIIKLVKSL